jgi:hypothetical protein
MMRVGEAAAECASGGGPVALVGGVSNAVVDMRNTPKIKR